MAGIGQHQVKGFGSPVPPWDDNMGPVLVRGNDNAIVLKYDAHDNDATMHINNGTFVGPLAITGTFDLTGATLLLPTGVFTPTLSFGGASVGVTYSVQTGAYTKVGNVVNFALRLALSSKGSSAGIAKISGLPFTNSNLQTAVSITIQTMGPACSSVEVVVDNSAATLTLFQITAGTLTTLADTDFTNGTSLLIAGMYRV